MFESGDACGSVRSALRPLRSVSGEGHTLKEHSGGGSLELIDSERAPESLESGQTECAALVRFTFILYMFNSQTVQRYSFI